MKRCILAFAVFALVLTSPAAIAAECEITNFIPERYTLMVITGADPGETLDKEKILALVQAESKKADVEQFQWIVYDQDKKRGDGLRAFGEIRKSDDDVANFRETEGENAQLQGKLVENCLGYEITPQKLHAIYSDNEVVADDDFKGKPIIMKVEVSQVSKDAFGKPYINVPVDKHGFSGLHIYIGRNDPFLRRIKKGSNILVKGFAKGLTIQSVMLDGVIVSDGESGLVDGEAVPISKIKKKEEIDKK